MFDLRPDSYRIIAAARSWAVKEGELDTILLIGSYARGEEKASSDIDMLFVSNSYSKFWSKRGWLSAWGDITRVEVDAGREVPSLSISFSSATQLEIGFVLPKWFHDASNQLRESILKTGYRVVYSRSDIPQKINALPKTKQLVN